MKRAWVVIGIILLLGVFLFEEQHRAETAKKHPAPASVMEEPVPVTLLALDPIPESNFAGQVDLWGDHREKVPAADQTYAGLNFQNDPGPASFERLQPRLDIRAEPAVTVLDREVAYSLFQHGSFKLRLNFKPAYPNPDAIVPSRIDPGVSGSFSF